MTKSTLTLHCLMAAAVLIAAPMAGQARDLTFASGWPPGGSVPNSIEDTVEWIKANSDLNPTHYPMSLLSFPETLAGLRDGVADIGYVLTPYFPKEFSETNLAADLTMLATSGKPTAAPGLAMSAALAEYVVLHCPDCQAQNRAQNQIYIGGGSTPDYSLLCDRPISKPEDLKGVKVRVGAANFGRWVENFGGVKVSISGGELYEAMSQNAVDCGAVAIPELINLQLIDVVSHITPGMPGGVFAGVGSANVNLDTWKSFTTEQRALMLKAGTRLMATINVTYVEAVEGGLNAAKDKGITFVEPSAELVAASAAFVDADIKAIGAQFASTYGVKDVDTKIAKVSELIDKWKDLVNPVYKDRDAFEALLWAEIYSKVDPATYGLN